MQRIIIDTNVLVSALIQRSYPFYILDSVFANTHIEICLSDELFDEYFNVLNREKFTKYPEFVTRSPALLASLKKRAVMYFPTLKIEVISDVDDNKLLELADASKADFLITGNTRDFTMQIFQETRIVSPREYWEAHLLQ
jgi:uncharacterized protein